MKKGLAVASAAVLGMAFYAPAYAAGPTIVSSGTELANCINRTAEQVECKLADGEEVHLSSNITIDNGKTVTLDLNGGTIKNTVNGTVFNIVDGHLIVKGEGKIIDSSARTPDVEFRLQGSYNKTNYSTLEIGEGVEVDTDANYGVYVAKSGNSQYSDGTKVSVYGDLSAKTGIYVEDHKVHEDFWADDHTPRVEVYGGTVQGVEGFALRGEGFASWDINTFGDEDKIATIKGNGGFFLMQGDVDIYGGLVLGAGTSIKVDDLANYNDPTGAAIQIASKAGLEEHLRLNIGGTSMVGSFYDYTIQEYGLGDAEGSALTALGIWDGVYLGTNVGIFDLEHEDAAEGAVVEALLDAEIDEKFIDDESFMEESSDYEDRFVVRKYYEEKTSFGEMDEIASKLELPMLLSNVYVVSDEGENEALQTIATDKGLGYYGTLRVELTDGENPVHDLKGNKLAFTIRLTKDLLGKEIHLWRYDEGQEPVEIAYTMNEAGDEITFESDLFSDFVVTYGELKNPNTFDAVALYAIVGGAAVVALAGSVVMARRKE